MATPADASARSQAAPDPMMPRIGTVRGRRHDSGQVWTLTIEEQAPQAARFQPGQFNMLTAFGVGEIPVSLSGDPRAGDRLIHTVRRVGAVSRALTQMRPGDAVGLRGPFGSGWPLAEAAGRDVLMVAGGLGLAPLRPALYQLLAERKRYGRIVVLYGTRSPNDILFGRQLEAWRQRSDIDLRVTVDHAAPGWKGDVGVVTRLIARAGCDPQQSVALVCGPEVMMRLSVAALRASGIEDAAIFLSMERNMKCAVAHCGRCQFGSVLVCRDGPVFRYDRVRALLRHAEI
jgi:NAD(P)H-flavin reductase